MQAINTINVLIHLPYSDFGVQHEATQLLHSVLDWQQKHSLFTLVGVHFIFKNLCYV